MDRKQAQVIAFQTQPQRLVMDKSGEQQLQFVGSMQVQRTLNHGGDDDSGAGLGFICGSLPVPTASPPKAFSSTAVVYQNKRVIAPHYRLLPAETDLNAPLDNKLPVAVNESGELWSSRLVQKCDALAASALSGHGDGIDVIAPVDILKQIFKTPYSKARLSVAVHRIGRTLILNSGPDEEQDTLVRQKKHDSKLGEKLLYSRFIHHSTKSVWTAPPESPAAKPGSETEDLFTPPSPWQVTVDKHVCNEGNLCATLRLPSENERNISQTPICVDDDDDAEYMEQETGTQKRTSDGFLRVLFWQFQNLRMLLGSDLLVFSNEKHVAVSLHLVDMKRQVTPLMWLDAWLDNIMASVPELAICYHHNGVVQGYELLKTDDIFSLKGLAEDGTVFFQPHVVQQNALSVLRFLQENCKHDPGSYWLFKNSGEDMLQLFDLTGLSKKKDDNCSMLPSQKADGGNRYTLPLAMLLYRIAYSLSRSQESSDICKCAKLFRKCLEFLDNQEHLIIKAITHEQVARLILNSCKEHSSFTKPILLLEAYETWEESKSERPTLDVRSANDLCIEELSNQGTESVKEELTLCSVPPRIMNTGSDGSDPVSARLAAVHHVSEAILSLRSQRQLQEVDKKKPGDSDAKQFPLCLCGDIECVRFYDIGSSEFGVLMDHKLRELVLMLGESYLALGEAYSEQGELSRAVKAAELACSVYASVLRLDNMATPYGCQYCLPVTSWKPPGKKLVPAKSGSQSDLHRGLFWGQLWRLIGDLYIKNLMVLSESGLPCNGKDGELQMAEDIVREVKRLRKKSGQRPGCGVCSASDCSCHMDRISSGSSATSSTEENVKVSRPGSKHRKSSKAAIVSEESDARKVTISEEQKPPGTSEAPYRQVCRNHVCFHLQRVLTQDLKPNFLAAVDCYDAAIYAFTDVAGGSRELEAALRKKGWACNELARLILAVEDLTLAETAYKTASAAFKAVGDSLNVVLVSINLGHALRSAAEKLVAWLSVGGFTAEKFEQISREAKELYEKALVSYKDAKLEVARLSNSELEEEVITQLANTYLRLGMFTVNQQTAAVLNVDGNEKQGTATNKLKSLPAANCAILEALVLYESVNRAQEAAYTHYHIGCHLKNCIQITKLKLDYVGDKNVKSYISLADDHFRKALQYYQPHTHPSMFLDILLVECELWTLSVNSHQMLDQAVSYMLEGRRAFAATQQPSSKATSLFLKGLQTLLKSVLGTAISLSKGRPADFSQHTVERVLDVAKLKEMYRIALRSTCDRLTEDLSELYALWSSSQEPEKTFPFVIGR